MRNSAALKINCWSDNQCEDEISIVSFRGIRMRFSKLKKNALFFVCVQFDEDKSTDDRSLSQILQELKQNAQL